MDIYAEITNRIINQLEQGVIPWRKPWVACGAAISYATGKPYSLLNQMLLGKAGEYLTFKQVQSAGGRVCKGEKSHMVVFWKFLTVEDEDTKEEKQVPLLRYYNVFHIDQCEGITAKHIQPLAHSAEPNKEAERLISDYCARAGVMLIHQEGDKAFYRPSNDTIVLPMMSQFTETAEYYSTAFHEMVHSTGHSNRLNRLTQTAHFGNEEYSKEELVAEIGASALVNHAGLETEKSFRNSTAYVQSWLNVLKNDKRFIVSASGKAEKAVELILAGA